MSILVESATSVAMGENIGIVILKRFLGHEVFPLFFALSGANYGVVVEDVGVEGLGVLVGEGVLVIVGVRDDVAVLLGVGVREGVGVDDGVLVGTAVGASP